MKRLISSLSVRPAVVAVRHCSSAADSGDDVPVPEMPKTLNICEAPGDAGIKVVSLNHSPINVMDLSLMSELTEHLTYLARPGTDTTGLVLTSSVHNVYSAGLDLKVLNENLNEVDFLRYWHTFQQLWLTMQQYPLPLVAAINGNAPAAGCILALSCDYRVMARESSPIHHSVADETNPDGAKHHHKPKKHTKFSIGITAAKAGFAAPPWVAANMSYVVGRRHAERMMTTGALLNADEAHEIGLVDEVVQHADEAVLAAVMEVEKQVEVPPQCRWMTKDFMRSNLIGHLDTKEKRAKDLAHFYEMLANPIIKERVGEYVGRLSKNKK